MHWKWDTLLHIATIRKSTTPRQWKCVSTSLNSAQCDSMGLTSCKFMKNLRWFHWPEFPKGPDTTWPCRPDEMKTEEDAKQRKHDVKLLLKRNTDCGKLEKIYSEKMWCSICLSHHQSSADRSCADKWPLPECSLLPSIHYVSWSLQTMMNVYRLHYVKWNQSWTTNHLPHQQMLPQTLKGSLLIICFWWTKQPILTLGLFKKEDSNACRRLEQEQRLANLF